MIYVWATLLVLLNLCFLALVALGLPGNWLMVVASAAVAWWQWDAGMFSAWTLAAVFALAVGGELLEFLAATLGTRGAGGSAWGAVGALGGCVAGALIGTFTLPVPLLGTLIGGCAGAFLGAAGLEIATGRGAAPALKSGLGGGIGRLAGTLGKLAVGGVIWVVLAVAAYWP